MVPLVLLVAAALILYGLKRQAEVGALPIPLESTSSPSSAAPASTPSTPPKDSTANDSKAKDAKAKDSKAKAAQAATALKRCRAKVRAADAVMAAGKVGMSNWADHVQAQTDANAGEISIGKMEDIFRRTQQAGDDDEKRYSRAVKAYHDRGGGSCKTVAGASARIGKQLARCADREKAQRPVLVAAKVGMADWTSHLEVMRRSEDGKVHNPQQKWLKTWRAAPPHINAYQKVAGRFSARPC